MVLMLRAPPSTGYRRVSAGGTRAADDGPAQVVGEQDADVGGALLPVAERLLGYLPVAALVHEPPPYKLPSQAHPKLFALLRER